MGGSQRTAFFDCLQGLVTACFAARQNIFRRAANTFCEPVSRASPSGARDTFIFVWCFETGLMLQTQTRGAYQGGFFTIAAGRGCNGHRLEHCLVKHKRSSGKAVGSALRTRGLRAIAYFAESPQRAAGHLKNVVQGQSL